MLLVAPLAVGAAALMVGSAVVAAAVVLIKIPVVR